jgi:23S rRNA pseudouridine1911/1915/1917 synthase
VTALHQGGGKEPGAQVIDFTCSEEDAGSRVDVVVARRARAPRGPVQQALREGRLTVMGKAVRPGYRLAPGDRVRGRIPAPGVPVPEAEDIAIPVRYADERVLVVSKPAGLVTHPAGGHSRGTLVNALLGLGVPLAHAGSARPGIIHRLDKDTSGLLLVAKDDDAHDFLVAALKRRDIGRRYLALVNEPPAAPSGTIDAPVGRHPRRRRLMAIVDSGRSAVTHYLLRASAGERGPALLELSLETGRTHQIRVHLAHIGHPVLGDRVYGGATDRARGLGLSRPFLHAHALTWPHPDDGRRMEVGDKLPADLAAALTAAGLDPPPDLAFGVLD